jgi:DNA polymerase III alpha subunit
MIHLHVHTNFSLLQGTVRIEELIQSCIKQKISSIALTDINAMNGLIQFAKQALEANINPILGSCITDLDDEKKYIILLAKNNDGYSDLCKIITQRKLNGDFSIFNIIAQVWNNLFILTPFIELLEKSDKKNSIYAEIISTSTNKKNALKTYQFAIDNNIPIVATNPVYFLKEEDYEIHKLVTAIRLNKTIDTLHKEDVVYEEFYFKEYSEIENIFKKIPEALSNSEVIAKQCNVDLHLGDYKYPKFLTYRNEIASALLPQIVNGGLIKRYAHITKEIIERVNKELEVINEQGLSDYFLIVWDIVNEAKKRGMILIGRGSAGNSIVAYCLGFTQIDPIKHNLYFERFMNSARKSPPDIDLDFSWKERDEIVKYIFEKYGYDKVAMISTTITFRARSAFRETAKAFGISEREISKFSKLIPWTNAVNLPHITEKFPESKNLGFDKEPWKTIVNLASKIGNFPRHLSIHPSGIVITPNKITEYCALEYAKNKGLGLIITQPDMYSIEELGLIKIDLLSQRSLGVLRDTMDVLNKKEKKI